MKVQELAAFFARVEAASKLDQRHTISVNPVNTVTGENVVFILSMITLIRQIDDHKVNDANEIHSHSSGD